MRTSRILISVLLAGGVVGWMNASAAAQPPAAPTTDPITTGKTIFMDNCAACHGDKGRGDGPAAKALTTRPADLSRLAAKDGTFPAAQITATLHGTSDVVAHGTPGMMIWGAVFNADYGNQADARIADVVKYIQSIQRK